MCLFYTRFEVITEWRPIQLSLMRWGEQISGCSLPSSLCESLSLPLYPLSMLSFLCQWWVSDFGIYESANAHAGGSVTNVAVCWASHGFIVHFQGCAYTQWITRLCVYECEAAAGHSKCSKDSWKRPILLRQGSLFFFQIKLHEETLSYSKWNTFSEKVLLKATRWTSGSSAVTWRFEMFCLWWIMS